MSEEREILTKVSETLTEKPFGFTIDVKPRGFWHRMKIKAKIKPSQLFYEIRPQRVVNIQRIAGRSVRFDLDGILNHDDRLGSLMKIMALHGEDIFYIVACILQNNHAEPTPAIITEVKNNFEMHELHTALHVGLSNYNITAFFSSIALITGVDALKIKASPATKTGV